MLEIQTHAAEMHKNESEVHIYVYKLFKKFRQTLTRITVYKKRHYSFLLSSKRLLEHRVLLPMAWWTRHFFVRYLVLCVIAIAKLNSSILAKKEFYVLRSNFIICIFVLRLCIENRHSKYNTKLSLHSTPLFGYKNL